MTEWYRGARARTASGRLRCLVAGAATVLASACQTVGGPGSGAGAVPAGPPVVVVAPGPVEQADQAAAAELLASAQASFEARRLFEALRTTERIVEEYPATDVSGEALRLAAVAHRELEDSVMADQVAERYLGLLPPGDPRNAGMRLLQAGVQSGAAARLDRLLRIGEGASATALAEATGLTRAAADSLQVDSLQAVVDGVLPFRGPLMPVAEARLSVSLLEMGRDEAAGAAASRAIESGVGGEDLAWAQGVLAGELPEGRGRETVFTIGAVLPLGGPPALAEFSALVAEGIEVAARSVLGDDFEVTIDIRDDEGDPQLTMQRLAELDSAGVVGVVGFLQDDDLLAAAEARARAIPLVSPTARSASRAGDAVYSLDGSDTEAAVSIARYAASRAFQRVAIVLPQTPEAAREADAFEAAAARLGMPVVGRFAYEAGATFFEPQIIGARNALRSAELARLALAEDDTLHMEVLEPTALFMPIPPEDVEFLAPQVVHFGLDTLAIEVLGTSGWTDPQVLTDVEARLTDNVVATAPTGSSEAETGREVFRQRYETYYQRSLVGTTASIGYDATLLLLEALRPGRIAPEQLRASFERIEQVAGATGVFSVVDGRVVRATEVVRIEGGATIPVAGDLMAPPDVSNNDDGR